MRMYKHYLCDRVVIAESLFGVLLPMMLFVLGADESTRKSYPTVAFVCFAVAALLLVFEILNISCGDKSLVFWATVVLKCCSLASFSWVCCMWDYIITSPQGRFPGRRVASLLFSSKAWWLFLAIFFVSVLIQVAARHAKRLVLHGDVSQKGS